MIRLLILSLVVPGFCKASTLNADKAVISTITALSGSGSIAISSFVYASSNVSFQGSAGVLATQSSVSASAFFGDGSHLGGLSSNSSSPTFSGADTFTSRFSVQSGGGEIILSTSSIANNLHINSNGSISLYPQFHNSSATLIGTIATSAPYLGPCIPGSTVTITTSGGAVELSFFGGLDTGGGYSTSTVVGFLQDGAFTVGFSSTVGSYFATIWGTQTSLGGSFNYLLSPAQARAGTHSYCISLANVDSENTFELYGDDLPFSTGYEAANQFLVEEIK